MELGKTETRDYEGSDCFFEFAVDRIPVDGIAPSELTNCGLLTATLHAGGGGEIVQLNLMVQVTQKGDKLHRMIYSPLG